MEDTNMCKDGVCEHDAAEHQHHNHDHTEHVHGGSTKSMAISATLHCLTGCAIGEVLGLILGTAFGLNNAVTTILAIALAFVFGFGLSTLPLLKTGIKLGAALSLVAAADTLSIVTMEIVDNSVMFAIPNAMHAGLVDPLLWISMPISLTIAFFAALPVNNYLLKKNKGHMITMNALGGHDHHH